MKAFYERLRARFPLLPVTVAILILGIFTLTRIGLAIYTGFNLVSLSLWPGIIIKGLWFDLAVIAVLIAPLCLYEASLPNGWRAHRWHGILRDIALWGVTSLLVFIAVAEATFWEEFSTRFNFIAVDYLIYTQEVIGNIRQSYPINWIMLAIGMTAAGIVWLMRPGIRAIDLAPVTKTGRVSLAVAAFLLPALSLGLVNVDQMQGLGNAYADELSGNGVLTFAAAFKRNELDYDKFYQTIPQEEADATLKQMGVERTPLSA